MRTKGLSQERIKLIACITMLLDHIGVALLPWLWLRIIGRISFPIFCFLLSEGVHHTRNPRRYALRLAICLLLSELPFDYALQGGFTWQYQNVMFTLLLGFCALESTQRTDRLPVRVLMILPFALAAEFLHTDYGGFGVVMVCMFGLTRGMAHERWIQAIMLGLICWFMPSGHIHVGSINIPIEFPAILAMIPIACYTGEKETKSKAVSTFFYIFYPLHLTILAILALIWQ